VPKYQNIILKILIAIILIGFTGFAYSADINFEATINKNKVSVGKSVQLSLTFHGTQKIPAPELPAIKNFESRYIGPSTMMSIVNGRVSSSIAHNYQLIPLKKGTYTLGPFSVTIGGKIYTSRAITIEVVKGPVYTRAQKQLPAGDQNLQDELRDRIFVMIEPAKTKLYLNESVPLTIKLFINRLAIRDVQYPQFTHDGFSLGDYKEPRQYRQTLRGISYDVLEFRTSIFGVKKGTFTVGPAQIKCNLVMRKQTRRRSSRFNDEFFEEDIFEDFFGRYETHALDLKSAEIPMTIIALPEKGKPKTFAGAVGRFNFDIKAEPKRVRVGDPIKLSMIISGDGNLNTVIAPEIESKEGLKIYEPQVKIEGNAKIFEQIFMPMSENINEIPKVTFSFFDPKKGWYRSITKGPLAIDVLPPKKGEELKIVESPGFLGEPLLDEKLGKDIIYIKESPGKLTQKGRYLYKNAFFLLLQLLPLILLIAVVTIFKRNEKLRTDTRYARRLRAAKSAKKGLIKAKQLLKEKKVAEFYGEVFKTLQEYLGNKFHLPPGGITINVVDEVLKPRHVSDNILKGVKDIFVHCDTVRYAPSEFGQAKIDETLKKMQQVVDELERQKI